MSSLFSNVLSFSLQLQSGVVQCNSVFEDADKISISTDRYNRRSDGIISWPRGNFWTSYRNIWTIFNRTLMTLPNVREFGKVLLKSVSQCYWHFSFCKNGSYSSVFIWLRIYGETNDFIVFVTRQEGWFIWYGNVLKSISQLYCHCSFVKRISYSPFFSRLKVLLYHLNTPLPRTASTHQISLNLGIVHWERLKKVHIFLFKMWKEMIKIGNILDHLWPAGPKQLEEIFHEVFRIVFSLRAKIPLTSLLALAASCHRLIGQNFKSSSHMLEMLKWLLAG